MLLNPINKIIGIFIATVAVAGCASQTPYFRMDLTLQKDVRTFGGAPYLPLARLCDVYGLDYKWDSFIKTATIQKGSSLVRLRAGSDSALLDGALKRIENPVILDGGMVYVPTSFVKNNLTPLFGLAVREKIPAEVMQKITTIKTVVIDPGHGGKDPGAINWRMRLKEKNMTLAMARKLKEILEDAGLKVVMTRNNDSLVSLPKRSEIANRSGADIFVSIHMNSSRSRSLKGFECYYLSEAVDDLARAHSAAESASLKISEGDSIAPSKRLATTLWDMTLTENRLESMELARYICKAVEEELAMSNRGIRPARFYVLKSTLIPAVLVEAGYISNRYEGMKLKERTFLERLADAVAMGILRYKREYERTEGFTKHI